MLQWVNPISTRQHTGTTEGLDMAMGLRHEEVSVGKSSKDCPGPRLNIRGYKAQPSLGLIPHFPPTNSALMCSIKSKSFKSSIFPHMRTTLSHLSHIPSPKIVPSTPVPWDARYLLGLGCRHTRAELLTAYKKAAMESHPETGSKTCDGRSSGRVCSRYHS